MTLSGKANESSGDDWVGELLVDTLKLAGTGMFRFALRWPDVAAVLVVAATTALIGGVQWALCTMTMGAAAFLWWR